jgi:hypothetical protein
MSTHSQHTDPTPDLFNGAPLGRLAYFKSKAELCGRLSAEQARAGDTKNAIANAVRMAQALEQAIQLEKEIGK